MSEKTAREERREERAANIIRCSNPGCPSNVEGAEPPAVFRLHMAFQEPNLKGLVPILICGECRMLFVNQKTLDSLAEMSHRASSRIVTPLPGAVVSKLGGLIQAVK